MPQAHIFRWRSGQGWLVLAGGGPWHTDANFALESQLLSHTHAGGPVAYIWAASDAETADRHLDALGDMGARTGYLVDIMTETDDTLHTQLIEAGIVILGDGPNPLNLLDGLVGPAMAAIEEAYERGATIYAPGHSAALMGTHILGDGEVLDGFGWLTRAFVVPYHTTEIAPALRESLLHYPSSYGAGLAEGAGLALGPRGQVEVWGNQQVTISLGQQYDPTIE